jgi:hypothetical protein
MLKARAAIRLQSSPYPEILDGIRRMATTLRYSPVEPLTINSIVTECNQDERRSGSTLTHPPLWENLFFPCPLSFTRQNLFLVSLREGF